MAVPWPTPTHDLVDRGGIDPGPADGLADHERRLVVRRALASAPPYRPMGVHARDDERFHLHSLPDSSPCNVVLVAGRYMSPRAVAGDSMQSAT